MVVITNAVHDCINSGKIVCHISSGTNRQSRLQQLIDWSGGEHFSGCLIFDECHKAKHFVPVRDLYRINVDLVIFDLVFFFQIFLFYLSVTLEQDTGNLLHLHMCIFKVVMQCDTPVYRQHFFLICSLRAILILSVKWMIIGKLVHLFFLFL